MAFEITEKLKVVNPNASADKQKGPYATIQDALTATANLREVGRTVLIVENPIYDSSGLYFIGGHVVEYWFENGIEDINLVAKKPIINHTGLFVNYTAQFNTTVGNNIQTFINQNNRIPNGSFTVTETTKPVYIQVTENLANGNSNRLVYAFIGGTGVWGNSTGINPTGTATSASMFKLLSSNATTVEDVTNDPNTRTISLGELADGDYVTAANSVSRDLSNDELIYYFSYTQEGVLYLVQFIGENGIYGGSGEQLVTEDFATSTNSEVSPGQDLASVLALGNTANNSINLIAPSGKTIITTGAVNVSYTGGANTVSGTLDTSGLTLKTSPTGVQGKIGSNNLTGTAKFYELPNSEIVNNTLALGISVNGAIAVRAGTNGVIPLTISGSGVSQNLESVLSNGNHTGNNNDIIFDNERAAIFKGGNPADQAIFSFNDEFNLDISQPDFKVNGKYNALTVNGVEADLNGNIDLDTQLGSQFIPITGTTEDNPVTGDVNIDYGASGATINFTDGTDYLSSLSDNGTRFLFGDKTGIAVGLSRSLMTESHDYYLPDKDGEIALLEDITGHTGLSDDLFIANSLFKYDVPNNLFDGRSMYYIGSDGVERYLDITPYVPSRATYPRLLTNWVYVNGNDIIIHGTTSYTTGANLYVLILKADMQDGVIKIIDFDYKEYTDLVYRDSGNNMYAVHGCRFYKEYLYMNTRLGVDAALAKTQLIKINPYNLNDFKVIELTGIAGSTGDIQVSDDGVFSVLSTSSTTGGSLVRTDLNLDNLTILSSTLSTGSTKRLLSSVPFCLYKGDIYIPTYTTGTTDILNNFIGLDVYNAISGKLVRNMPSTRVSTGATSGMTIYPHWIGLFQGQLIIHTATAGTTTNHLLIRIDTSDLTVKESVPISNFSGSTTTRITDNNSISKEGFIYLNEELNSVNGKLYIVKYNDFTNFQAVTPTGNGGYYYSGGSPDRRYDYDYKSTTLQTVLNSTSPALSIPTSPGNLTIGVKVNGSTFNTGVDGYADLGTISGGGGGTTYTGTTPIDVTGSVISVLTDSVPTASSTNLLSSGNILTALNLKGTLASTNTWTAMNTFSSGFTIGSTLVFSGDNTISIGGVTNRAMRIFATSGYFNSLRPSNTTSNLAIQSYDLSATWLSFDRTTGVGTFTFSPIVPTPTTATQAANKGYVDGLNTKGTNTQSGVGGSTITYNIPHGLGVTPTYARADAKNAASAGIQFVTWDATNIIITYSVAPASGTNNLSWGWIAFK